MSSDKQQSDAGERDAGDQAKAQEPVSPEHISEAIQRFTRDVSGISQSALMYLTVLRSVQTVQSYCESILRHHGVGEDACNDPACVVPEVCQAALEATGVLAYLMLLNPPDGVDVSNFRFEAISPAATVVRGAGGAGGGVPRRKRHD